MMGTVYEKDYKAEHLQNTVDNMNLLYVAFTRAGKNLVITGKRMSANKFNSKTLPHRLTEVKYWKAVCLISQCDLMIVHLQESIIPMRKYVRIRPVMCTAR